VADFGRMENHAKYWYHSTYKIYTLLKFWFGGCSPAVPTLGCAFVQNAHCFLSPSCSWNLPCALHSEIFSTPNDANQLNTNMSCLIMVFAGHIIVCRIRALVHGYLPDVNICLAFKKALHNQNPHPIPWLETCSVHLHHWRRISVGVTLFASKNQNIVLTSTFDHVCRRHAIYNMIVLR
jgi:hypothetical protein